MLEIYNYVIGILIGILFSFSNHNESNVEKLTVTVHE